MFSSLVSKFFPNYQDFYSLSGHPSVFSDNSSFPCKSGRSNIAAPSSPTNAPSYNETLPETLNRSRLERKSVPLRIALSQSNFVTPLDIRMCVSQDFIAKPHMAAIEQATRRGNFAVSFRATGTATIAKLIKGAPAKGHDIVEKTVKLASLEKGYGTTARTLITTLREAGVEGCVGRWDRCGKLTGIYFSRKARNLAPGFGQFLTESNIYPIDLNYLDESLEPLRKYPHWMTLAFTGDYDIHDMISFTGRPHVVPSASIDEYRIRDMINHEVSKCDTNRPFHSCNDAQSAQEYNVIRHGPQVSYVAYMRDKEKLRPLSAKSARPGDFPIAMCCKGQWSLIRDTDELEDFYRSVGAIMKDSWKKDGCTTFEDIGPDLVKLKHKITTARAST